MAREARALRRASGRSKGKAKDPPKKKSKKRGTRSADATARREQQGQAKRLASALERAEAERSSSSEADESRGQGSSSAGAPRRVLTYTQAEAKAKAKAESRKRPIRRVQAETEEQPVERIKWKKERKRHRRRSHNPRITLKSVEREAAPIRLRSAARPVQKARKRSAELKELLEAAKKDWDTADYRGRRKIQEVLKPRLPRGSIAETLRKQAGLAEACSSCGESSSTGHWCGAGCSGGFRGQS